MSFLSLPCRVAGSSIGPFTFSGLSEHSWAWTGRDRADGYRLIFVVFWRDTVRKGLKGRGDKKLEVPSVGAVRVGRGRKRYSHIYVYMYLFMYLLIYLFLTKPDRTFEIKIGQPTVTYFLKAAAGIEKGARQTGKGQVGPCDLGGGGLWKEAVTPEGLLVSSFQGRRWQAW